jgi:hypothetical protein
MFRAVGTFDIYDFSFHTTKKVLDSDPLSAGHDISFEYLLPVLVFEAAELHGSEALILPRISLMLKNRVLNEGQEVLTHLLQVLVPRPKLYFSHDIFSQTCSRLVSSCTLKAQS